ncbi:rod shape-determining protein RodA [Bailinhaonella thermotolerans]|uniref:peptidoglycan glycosyltransferase n=1 Tax=Bailinhaonella thermotolerans TaxID=1070861 RepID=A0A3A4B5P5_9ACTN|nr:rod shape-determining protein RodA [Bailinhaonella thermotolerans]RJL32722.1 rod shape-determining protein RodA [Bailinhaonella thermotolerans]
MRFGERSPHLRRALGEGDLSRVRWVRHSALRGTDWWLLAAVSALAGLGVLLVWSSTRPRLIAAGEDPQAYLKRQIVNVALGLALLLVIAFAGRGTLRAWTPPAYLLGCLGLAAVLTPLGMTVNGSRSWLGVGGFQFQPSEIVKVTVVLGLASLFGDHGERRPPAARFGLALLLAAVPFGLVMLQPDLGTGMILAVTVLGVLVVARVRLGWLALLAGAGVAAGALAWWLDLLQPHQVDRLLAFADPGADPRGAGYNAARALVTVGSGGLLGRGLFHGDQTGGRFVPEQHTDFVFTVAGEELGFAGSALILILLWAVIWRGLRIAAHAASPYGTIAAAGIVCWLAVQTFVNVGMVLGVVPVVGVPLPFVSYGGSAVVASMAAVGVLISIGREAARPY